jgi:hypothetical protein
MYTADLSPPTEYATGAAQYREGKTTMIALLSTQGHAFFLAPTFSKMKATT